MSDQNQSVLDNLDRMIGLIDNLFFNEKKYVARQIYRHWLPKPHWGYKPVQLDGDLQKIVYRHLTNRDTYGFYSHSLSATCKWICIDIDLKFGDLVDRMDSVTTVLGMVLQRLADMGIPEKALLIEFSGSKGFHVWVMINETPMAVCQNFVRHFLNGMVDKLPYDAGLGKLIVDLDKFPHPTTDPEIRLYGYAVKIPCGLHKKVGEFSRFVDINRKPIVDVPALLENVVLCDLPILPLIETYTKPKHAQKPKKQSVKTARKRALHAVVGAQLPQPAMTPDLNALFTNCRFLKGFRARPELSGFKEWTHAGLMLIPLGETGIAWFHYLSSLDLRRYDGSHQQLIDNVFKEGLSAPKCGTIGCTLCDRDHPYQILDTVRRRYSMKYKTDMEPTVEEIDLADLRSEYRELIKDVVTGNTGSVVLSTMPVGGYKTTTVVEMANDDGVRCVYYCPNHQLAQDIQGRLKGKGVMVRGLEKMLEDDAFHCPHADDLLSSLKYGRSAGHYCNEQHGKCDQRSSCPYLRQFRRAARAKVAILVHDHLHLGNKKWKQVYSGKHIAVLDESFHRQYRTPCIVTRSQLETLKEVLMEEVNAQPVHDLVNPLLDMLDAKKHSMIVPVTGIMKNRFPAIDSMYWESHPFTRNPLRDLLRAGKERLTARSWDAHSLQINLPARLPEDIPILILDATAQKEDYERLLGRSVEEINPAAGRQLRQYAKTIQVLSGAYPNSSLFQKNKAGDFIPDALTETTGERIVEYALGLIRDPNDYGIICTQLLEQWLIKHRGIPEERIMHFNLLRGMNNFRNVLDLIVIGYQGI
ncbi:hypothetical protein ACFL34_02900, partial [Candidatus Sumerlaeota bacterium]